MIEPTDLAALALIFLLVLPYLEITRSISIVSKLFVFEVFVVKPAQAAALSIIVLMCDTVNDRTALKVTDVGLKLHHLKGGGGLG